MSRAWLLEMVPALFLSLTFLMPFFERYWPQLCLLHLARHPVLLAFQDLSIAALYFCSVNDQLLHSVCYYGQEYGRLFACFCRVKAGCWNHVTISSQGWQPLSGLSKKLNYLHFTHSWLNLANYRLKLEKLLFCFTINDLSNEIQINQRSS